MTPSIIRRFARYHGVFHVDILDIEGQVLLLAERIYGSHDMRTVARIVQSLTRIEDAEHCLHRSTVRYFNRTDEAREEAAMIAAEFFAIAGIDEEKWREVKDE